MKEEKIRRFLSMAVIVGGIALSLIHISYKESQYLEECIQSVLNQNVKSKVIISTGTPNSYIKEIAEKYKLQLFVNPNPSSLASDWNFAMSCAETELITLAHQDDVYEKGYSANIWKAYNLSLIHI